MFGFGRVLRSRERKRSRRHYPFHAVSPLASYRRVACLEALEPRALLTTFYVDNNLSLTADRDQSGGLTPGDQVTFGNGQPYQQADLTYDAAPADGDVGTAFSSIGQALASPLIQPGDTIDVAGGTYTEAITIDMSLSLQGEGDVVIQSPTADSGTGISIDANAGTVTLANIDVAGFQTALSGSSLTTLNLTNVRLPGNFGSVFTDPRNEISNVTNLNVVDTSSQPQTVDFDVGPPMGMIPYLEMNNLAIAVDNVTNISVTTASGSDTFNVAPIAKTITIDPGVGTPPAQPANTLNEWLPSWTGNSLSVTKDSSGYSGTWSFAGGDSVQFSNVQTLSPGVLVQGYQTINATQGTDTGPVLLAQFTDPLGNLPLSAYSADIDWTDGTTSSGTVSYDAATGTYSVYGDHVFGRVEGSTVLGQPGVLASELKIVIHRTGSPDTTTYATAFVAPRAPEVFYVDQNLKVTEDRDQSGGLTPGDQVTFGNGQSYQQADLTYAAAPVNGDVGTAFSSITQAIASPLVQPGDTIEIAGGTYTGGFNIPEDLTLEGQGDVVIAAAAQNASQTGTGITIAYQPDSVTLKNLTIQGFQTSIYDPGGGTLTLADVDLIDGETLIDNLDHLDVISDSTASDPVIIDIVRYVQPLGSIMVQPFMNGSVLPETTPPPANGSDNIWIPGQSLITFSGVTNLSFATGAGVNDTISVSPLPDTAVSIDGDDSIPPGAPGDTLDLPTNFSPGATLTVKQDATGLSGTWTVSGSQPVSFSHIASLSPGIVPLSVPAISGTQGVDTGSQVVAQFTNPAGPLAAGDTAEIAWGDGSQPSAGTITYDASTGVYSVLGSHTYTKGGDFAISVDLDTPGSTVILPNATANIAPTTAPQLSQIRQWALMPTVGQSTANMDLVTYSDTVDLPASDYSAEINWGDGATTSGTITTGGLGSFGVFGDHSYAQPGMDQITVTVLRNGVVAGTMTAIAYVTDHTLTDTPETLSGTAGVALGGLTGALVALFEEPLTDTGDFQASIDWGDGSTSSGTVVEQGFTPSAPDNRISWQVYGSHTYQQPGTYDVRVSLTEYYSPTETANVVSWIDSTATVAPASDPPQNANPTSSQAAVVTKLYQQVLGRAPDTAGLAYWVSQVEQGKSYGLVAQAMFESTEHLAPIIEKYYQTFLDRPADPAGVNYWYSSWIAHGGPAPVVAGMIVSPEFFASAGEQHPNLTPVEAWLTAVYERLLDREPDRDGLTYWTNQLQTGALNLTQVVDAFQSSPESDVNLVTRFFQEYLGRNPSSAELATYVNAFEAGASQSDVQVEIVNLPEYSTTGLLNGTVVSLPASGTAGQLG